MDKPIKSKALEANLAQTRNVEITIPEKYVWFLSLSENYWGIHQRTKEFISELYHPYSNRKEVIDLLINLSISSFWIYKEIKEREKVLDIFLEIFDSLFQEDLPEELSKKLIFSFLDFFKKNYQIISQYEKTEKRFLDILEKNLKKNRFAYISNISYFIKTIELLAVKEKSATAARSFMRKLIKQNIEFWDTTTNIEAWYENNKEKMSTDYTDSIKALGKGFFEKYYTALEKAEDWDSLIKSTFSFSDIIDVFRKKTDDFKKPTEQFSYLFYLIHLPGMLYHRNYLLIDLNTAIKRISHELDEKQSMQSIDELFSLFTDFKESHTDLILDSILTLGKEIINTGNTFLIHYFEKEIIKFGFINPGVRYLTDNWELKVNPNHVKNIRVWLDIIEYNPEMMKDLLSALIINLRVGGIFIFDTDLFQKDVTKLLNANISPIYKQIKQLTRIFPVYFNEIGAEGLLRDVSTQIDEVSRRNDKLIHFLRKQIHTEGNNSHIQITSDIIHFWYDLNKKRLKGFLPKNVYDAVDVDSIWVKGVHELLQKICSLKKISISGLLSVNKDKITDILSEVAHDNKNDIKRVRLIIELYQILNEKYSFKVQDIIAVLKHFHFIDKEEIEKLETSLLENNDLEALKLIYSIMVQLNQIIFDEKISEGWESIYYKRHVAYGIPSMYGEYHEKKFEALGLTFRMESIASILINKIISKIKIDYFTAKTLKDIFSVIQLLREGLYLDGIYDQGFDSRLKMFQYSLTSKSFTIKQYINIFQFMEVSIKEIISKYFIRPYDKLMHIIIPQYLPKEEKNSDTIKKKIIRKSEIFYRELLSSAFIIQSFDHFIGEILHNLRNMVSKLSDEEIQSIMSYDSDFVLSPIYLETPSIDNQVFLGSKAYYLKNLYLNNYPVPPGFVITTEVFRRVNSIIKLSPLNAEMDNLIKHYLSELESISGLEYGNAGKPLLLSVRSGAAISLPGAMNTFLNVGLNDEITEKLSKRENYGWTSWDCYRRLLQTWGMSYGLDRNDFDQIIIDYKKKYNITQKVDFPPHVMKEIAFTYKKLLTDNNIAFEEDPFLQLKQAIISVFNSWFMPRAKAYREHMQIANEWGTAVIVQQMVFGNLHYESGSGVIFTHDNQDNVPGISLTGDFSFVSQGEDIVSGLVNPLPISERQRKKFYKNADISLESVFPEIFSKLNQIAHELIEVHGYGHQEIEFTFETAKPEDLYILQTREMSILKQNKMEVFAETTHKKEKLATGIGIGNKVLNGAIVFDKEDLEVLKKKFPGQNAVLVRPDTVPDDIELIFESEGLLTSKGGATSHAAVTAEALGKICVVNCADMLVYENEKKCIINETTLYAFDLIAIDGNNGIVYKGNYQTKIQEF